MTDWNKETETRCLSVTGIVLSLVAYLLFLSIPNAIGTVLSSLTGASALAVCFYALWSWNAYQKASPCWEVVADPNGVMCHIRWSQPGEGGRFLWVSHYPASPWGLNAIEREAARMNDEGRRPEEWP